jgi:hypothetical protein
VKAGGPVPTVDVALPLETVLLADIVFDDTVLVVEGPVDGVLVGAALVVVVATAPLAVKTVKEESLFKPAVTTRVSQRLYGEANGVVYSLTVPRKVPIYVHVPVVELMSLHSKVWFVEGSPILVRAAVDGPSTMMLVQIVSWEQGPERHMLV